MTIKKPIAVLCLLWLSLAVQGCTGCMPGGSCIEYSSVTITVDGQPKVFYFASIHHNDHTKHLREVLEKLERGEPVAIDQPDEDGIIPLAEAVRYALGETDSSDENLDVARYLLEHHANIEAKEKRGTTPMHALCFESCCRASQTAELNGFVLLLAYGAKLDAKSQCPSETPIDVLEECKPWITREMRDYYIKKKEITPGTSKQVDDIPPWEEFITPSEQRTHKQQYWTQVVQALLQAQQHKPLHAAFVDYVAQAGVEAGLVQQLQDRT